MQLTFPLTSRRKSRFSIRIIYIIAAILCTIGYILIFLLQGFMYNARKDINDPSSSRIVALGIDGTAHRMKMMRGNTMGVSLRNLFSSMELEPLQAPLDYEKYTIRINTYRRNEQLLVSLNHHSKCEGVAQIQVVWCDLDNDPPQEILHHPSGKVFIEQHSTNSLNERFRIVLSTPTIGIFSIDDDVLRPCQAIDSAFFQWTRNPERMVGYDPRVHVITTNDGSGSSSSSAEPNQWQYGALSIAESTGTYSMVLTRSVFLHRDYLNAYVSILPRSILDRIEKTFNCEDIAMTLLVSTATNGKPPLLASLWARKTLIKLYHLNAISGEAGQDTAKQEEHRQLRNFCVDSFAQQLGLKEGSSTAKKLRTSHFLVQHRSIGEFEASPFTEDNSPIPALPNRQVDREIFLLKQWNTATSRHALVEQWIKESSSEAKEKGLITKTAEWRERWDSNTLIS